MKHFRNQEKPATAGPTPIYRLNIPDIPTDASSPTPKSFEEAIIAEKKKKKKQEKKERQRQDRTARFERIREIVWGIMKKQGVEVFMGFTGKSPLVSSLRSGSSDNAQPPATPTVIAPVDPAEVDKILNDFIDQLIKEDEEDSPEDNADSDTETDATGSESEDSTSEPDSDFDTLNPPVYEPITFESVIDEGILDESVTCSEPADSSMLDALSQLEISLAELSMQDPNPGSAGVEEPEGTHSFMWDSPDGSGYTSTPPLPQRFLDDSMLGIDTHRTPADQDSEHETSTDDDVSEVTGSNEPSRPQVAARRWGASIGECLPALQRLHSEKIGRGQSPAEPFVDWLEFEFVKWMIERDISQGSREILLKLPIIASRARLSFASNYKLNQLLNKLPVAGPKWNVEAVTTTGDKLGPDGEPVVEKVELWFRDILGVIKELLGNHIYGKDLVFAAREEFEDAEGTQRKYDEMWTGDWWLKLQMSGLFPNDATILPVILASDATQLTNFGGGKIAYPVYITSGNIPKAIRRKPNSYGTLLLGYLPVPKLECFTGKTKTHQKERVFHQCMKKILKPLEQAGRGGVEMECGDGHIRKCFPILAAYCADNPEQTQVACCKRNLCYRCMVGRDQRGDYVVSPDRHHVDTANPVTAQSRGRTTSYYVDNGLRPFGPPFWADLPHCNIHTALTPGTLHQLHKGVFKDHLMKWCLSLVNNTEFNDRFKAMPEHPHLRHFKKNVSELSQTTGKEHREMEKVFLGVISGLLPDEATAAARALLDFIYYAQLPSHNTATIQLLENALASFHARKDVFIRLGAREHFNINKLHSLMHYATSIREMGALDGYNTESPERLHIDFAKRAYKATNRNDFIAQMVDYLERRERVFKFDAYLKWAIPEYAERDLSKGEAAAARRAPGWHIAKESPFKPASFHCLESVFGVRWFEYALCEFLEDVVGRQIEVDPSDKLIIFPKATQYLEDDLTLENWFADTFYASPHASMTRLSLQRRGSRFDTVLIRREQSEDFSYGIKNHTIGEVRMIFTLPPRYGIADPLVFVNEFSSPGPGSHAMPNQHTGMYSVKRKRWPERYDSHYVGKIFYLSDVRRSCHLIPEFGRATKAFSSSSPPALESYDSFYLNAYLDLHSLLFLNV